MRACIQAVHGAAWGLGGRRQDREGLALGWELVCAEIEGLGGVAVMGDQFFLGDYGVASGDTLAAVVRRYPPR